MHACSGKENWIGTTLYPSHGRRKCSKTISNSVVIVTHNQNEWCTMFLEQNHSPTKQPDGAPILHCLRHGKQVSVFCRSLCVSTTEAGQPPRPKLASSSAGPCCCCRCRPRSRRRRWRLETTTPMSLSRTRRRPSTQRREGPHGDKSGVG